MNKITVVGAGVMGRGIAYVSSLAGFSTTLVDVSDQQLKNAKEYFDKTSSKGVDLGKITSEQRKTLFDHIQMETDMEKAAASADMIIEAVPEKKELKQQIMERVDQIAPEYTIFATNTSTISPTEIGSYTNRPSQVAVMHFFNPVHRMPLVEIVRGLETSDETVKAIKQAAKGMDKETVEVNEFPGFVTSRISALIGNEAFYMLQEGVAEAEDIDKAIRLGLNFPMGPLELGDLVGLDARLNNLKYLHRTLGEKYRPAPLMEQMVQAGRLGRKTNRGIYNYS